MKPLSKVTAIAVAVALSFASSSAQSKRGPSTPAERAKAVQAARLLESDPFNKDAKELRHWLTVWLTEVPDITVPVCGAFLGPVFGSKKNFDSEIFGQTLFSSAALLIEHPDQAGDRVAVHLGGLEGALRAYEAILKSNPKARWPHLDDLIAKREKGELRAYVQQISDTKCKR